MLDILSNTHAAKLSKLSGFQLAQNSNDEALNNHSDILFCSYPKIRRY